MIRSGLVLAGTAGVAALAGRRFRNLGTQGDEATRALPGDDLVPDASLSATMAMTLQARPEDVFPWLVQMGHGRAGWYSLDLIDNAGVRSADRIEPRWQQLAAGDRMPARPRGKAWFEVVELEPTVTMVLRATLTVPGGRSVDPSGPRPSWLSDSTWAYVLEPLGQEATRLLVRLRVGGTPRRATALGNALVLGPGHLVMQRRQLSNLRGRIEARAD